MEYFNGEKLPGWDLAHVQDDETRNFCAYSKDFFAWHGPYNVSTTATFGDDDANQQEDC